MSRKQNKIERVLREYTCTPLLVDHPLNDYWRVAFTHPCGRNDVIWHRGGASGAIRKIRDLGCRVDWRPRPGGDGMVPLCTAKQPLAGESILKSYPIPGRPGEYLVEVSRMTWPGDPPIVDNGASEDPWEQAIMEAQLKASKELDDLVG